MFKNGGSCATMMTPAQYVEATRKGRLRKRVKEAIDRLGEKWIMHPLNQKGWNYQPEEHMQGEDNA